MYFMIFFLLLPFPIHFADTYYSNVEEQKAFRRDMVELDIETRNLASAIALGNARRVALILQRLSSSRAYEMPRYKNSIQRVHKKLRAKGNYKYLARIYSNAQKMYKKVMVSKLVSRKVGNKYQKVRKDIIRKKINWKYLGSKFKHILSNCRKCHEKMMDI